MILVGSIAHYSYPRVQEVMCDNSLHRVYVISTVGDYTLLELANHLYYVILVLVLVLIKDYLNHQKDAHHKASVYP